ncbi:recombinase family protein [Paenibacillus sp. tmac-D7]|uniref:recombinase family protein n=1 Tax=Paenibacillus sp. tmac-D7 TaxID=2591462 RepID=UPI0015E85922|nr:recombinase family protein [Paenibacillus sp. tmac-D7]
MRYAIYARVSTTLDSQKDSIVNQISYFHRYVDEKGGTIYDVYKDEGVSGVNVKNRREMQRLLKDARAKRFDYILFKSISRFARDNQDGINMKREMDELGIGMIFMEQNIDTLSVDEFQFMVYLSFAQKESEGTSARVKWGRREKAIRGEFNGSLPPFGYKRDGNNLVLDEQYVSIAKDIFRLYLYEGWGLSRISKYLCDHKVPTPRTIAGAKNAGELWQQSTIKLILTNPAYMGHMIQHRSEVRSIRIKKRTIIEPEKQIPVKHTHPALITEDEFYQIQEKLKHKGLRKSNGQESIFAHTAVCADCGTGMHYKKDRNGYQCGRYGKYGKQYCSSHLIKYDPFLAQVKESLKQLKLGGKVHMKKLMEIVDTETNSQLTNYRKELSQIEKRINLLIRKQSSLHEQHLEGDITKEEWRRLHSSTREEIEVLEHRKVELSRFIQLDEEKESRFRFFEKQVKTLLSLDFENEKILKCIVDKLILKIEVYEGGNIKIHYNFRNPEIQQGA